MTFTEMRSGEVGLDEAEIDIDALLDRVASSFAPLARARDKDLSRGPRLDGGLARADEPKLELAISCLVSNVLLHGGPTARVEAVRDDEGRIMIAVQDSGSGIRKEDHLRALAAFSRPGALHTRAADGMGLGLPLARRLIELHGGGLELEPQDNGFFALATLPASRSS